jgi:hypothetical protein
MPLVTLMSFMRSPGPAVALLIVAACGDNQPVPASDAGEVRELVAVPTASTNKLDLLFVLGNSASTLEHQFALANAFPSLLAQISAQGRPSLHIGGITPDLGTSTMSGALGPPIAGSAGGCSGHGDGGGLKRSNANANGEKFLIDTAITTNHPNPLAVDIRDVTVVGSAGCGFQQDLAAIRASFTNELNAGFRRDDAALSIVMLADKDECSALDPNLFSSDTSELGPLSSFRCVNFGYSCSEPDMTSPGPRTNCVPNPRSTVIEDPAAFVAVIRAQVADPRRVSVGAIIAPSDVEIELPAPGGSMTPMPAVAHSCIWPTADHSADVANPAVRLEWLANQFGDRGAIGSICNEDLSAAMTTMGINARRAMGDPCIEDDVDLAHCTAVEEVDGVETLLVACESAVQSDCYELATDPVACPNAAHRKLVVRRSGPAPAGYDLLRCR